MIPQVISKYVLLTPLFTLPHPLALLHSFCVCVFMHVSGNTLSLYIIFEVSMYALCIIADLVKCGVLIHVGEIMR